MMTTPMVTVLPDDRLKQVAQLLLKLRIGAAPMVDRGAKLAGILSETDLVALETTHPATTR